MYLARVFIPFAFGYFLSYFYRVVNAVIAPDLVTQLGLNPSDLGLLTSVYFLTFAGFQLPLGVLLDRFGPRRVEASLLVVAAIGAFIFSQANTAATLMLGRALIGLGVSACLMAAFKAFSMWFPQERLPFVNGFQMAAGGLGALTATAPVETALQVTDWRGVFAILAGLTLLVAIGVLFVVPKRKVEPGGNSIGDQLQGIVQVFTSPLFWRITPLTVMTQSTFLSIQGLWAGLWLRDVAGLDRMSGARVLLSIAAAMVGGFILLGGAAERLSRVGIRPAAVAVSGMGIFILTQLFIILGWTSMTFPLWVLFGFFGTSGIISYAVLSQAFPLALTARANTGINLLVFVVAFAQQWGIGAIINLWPTSPDGAYATPGYQASFGLMMALELMALAWFFVAGLMIRSEKT